MSSINWSHKKSRYKLKQDYLKSHSKEFMFNYERKLIEMMNSDIATSFRLEIEGIESESYDINYIQSDEYEINILETALTYVTKSSKLYIKLLDRINDKIDDNNKMRKFNHYCFVLADNSYKTIFLGRRLKQLGINVDIKKTIEEKSYNKAKTNTLSGKQINLYERFLIANEVLQIETKIRTLKISEAEKHNLLSLILGCNIDNAKKIMNGSYDAKVKEDLLQDYFKTLKK
ncbi:hypothetical protein [Polaribacter glomeratus]|uniref:Uncharacterized protein n=1 Tax=Polaribacter glomeratus TaxID=102 RepID=A0A2S7WYF9_9FLAO|nr:hypothetical protein [Polaribacter glomeratus]PQJ82627.1 hypothetical protein BTO16_08580 [Polaribacter glomeratus]TXD64916.1 hypothetical protein ESX12_12285 [Polaribacter glomeratus]